MNIKNLLKKRNAGEKMTKKEQDTLWKKLRDKADQVFSIFIRNRDKLKGCITCGGPIQHCCHWIDRGWYSHRRDEKNCRGGCANCNTYHAQEHSLKFTIYQTKTYGQERVDRQLLERNKIKPDIDDLLYIIDKYKQSVN